MKAFSRHPLSTRARTMLGYSLFTLILVLFSALVLTGELNRRLESEADKGNRAVLAQVQIYGDMGVVGRIKTFVAEKFLDLSQDPSVMEFFTGTGTTANLIQVQKAIQALALQGQGIFSVQLYRDADGTLVSSDSGFSFHALETPVLSPPTYDPGLIRQVLEHGGGPRWVDPRTNRKAWEGRSVLTYVQAVPLFPDADRPLGCFLVNFDSEAVRKLLLSAKEGSYDFSLAIVSDDGRVMAAELPADLDSPDWAAALAEGTASADTGQLVVRLNGEETAMAWARSSLTDWKYVSMTPLARYRQPLTAVLQGVALIVVILSVLGLVIVNVLTFRLHAPLQRLVAKARANLGPSGPDSDDWSVVDGALQRLSTQVTAIEQTLQENAGSIERSILDDLLEGRTVTRAQADERLALIGKRLPAGPLRLVTFLWEPRTFAALPWDRREYLSYDLMARVATAFREDQPPILGPLPGGGVRCLTGRADAGGVARDGLDLISRVAQDWSLELNVVVGDSTEEPSGLPALAARARADQAFGFFTGYGRAWMSRDLEEREGVEIALTTAEQKDWETVLRAGKSSEAADLLFAVLNRLKTGGFSPASGHRLIRTLVGSAGRVWSETGVVDPVLAPSALEEALVPLATLAEFRELFHGWLEAADRARSDRASEIDRDRIDGVLRWIGDHLGTLTLATAADYAGMGESHFSRWFKHTLGIGFSEYVVQRKFDEAARRLASGPGEPIQELARDLGYSDHSYFAKLFKERFGMTPMQYRKKAASSRSS